VAFGVGCKTGKHFLLVRISYPGANNFTDFVYDGLGRCVKIVETTAGSVTSTKQFVWCAARRCEERDGSGTLTKQFFAQGQKNGSSSYFYAPDHLGSVREMTDASGTIQAQYRYSPYGERTVISETVASDFAFTGHYLHARSGLALTLLRAYNATFGRFINRDPVAERGGINLFGYVSNSPTGSIDVFGGYGSTGSNSGGGSTGTNGGGGSAGSNGGGGSFGGNSKGCRAPGWGAPGDPPKWVRNGTPPGWDGPPAPPGFDPTPGSSIPSAAGGNGIHNTGIPLRPSIVDPRIFLIPGTAPYFIGYPPEYNGWWWWGQSTHIYMEPSTQGGGYPNDSYPLNRDPVYQPFEGPDFGPGLQQLNPFHQTTPYPQGWEAIQG
jgi:RHS repeat-associated protein